jgi:hypothetical protein
VAKEKITAEHLSQYKDWRAAQGVGPTIINMERGMIRKLLKKAKRWRLLADECETSQATRSRSTQT